MVCHRYDSEFKSSRVQEMSTSNYRVRIVITLDILDVVDTDCVRSVSIFSSALSTKAHVFLCFFKLLNAFNTSLNILCLSVA